ADCRTDLQSAKLSQQMRVGSAKGQDSRQDRQAAYFGYDGRKRKGLFFSRENHRLRTEPAGFLPALSIIRWIINRLAALRIAGRRRYLFPAAPSLEPSRVAGQPRAVRRPGDKPPFRHDCFSHDLASLPGPQGAGLG